MKQSKAIVSKRQNDLMNLFDETGTLWVNDAAKILQVSPITIRRDLQELEQNNRVIRFHGGAHLIKQDAPILPQVSIRGNLQTEQKLNIAKYAASLVNFDRITVFLNAGTTTYLVIKELCDSNIRIITNNAAALDLFDTSKNAELILTGGRFNSRNRSYEGDLANVLLSRVHADMCILGVNGISSQEGITTYSYQETLLNQTMIKRCTGKKIIVADGTKVGKLYCFTSLALSDIDILVTDSSADPHELELIRKAAVDVVIADTLTL